MTELKVMVNTEIITYVQTELKKGTDKQTITTSLLANGWNNGDISEAFTAVQGSQAAGSKRNLWHKSIPKTNNVFGVIFAVLVFGLDLFIIITGPDLVEFWYIMLGVFAIFALFYFFENYAFRKDFANSPELSVDRIILGIITVRNIIFLLNFIPVIQILGLGMLVYLGGIILSAYIILIVRRYRQTKKAAILG